MRALIASAPFPTDCPEHWHIIQHNFAPSSIWSGKNVTLVKKAPSRIVLRADGFYIKAFRTGILLRYLRDPALKEFNLAQILHSRRLTAPPVAFGSRNGWSYVVTKEIKGADLQTFIDTEWAQTNSWEHRRICQAFAEFLADLAASGFFQPDFHLNNILFNKKNCRFLIIDLHRAHLKSQPLSTKAMLNQLSWCLPPFIEVVTDTQILTCASFLKTTIPELADKATRFSVVQDSYRKMRRHWHKKNIRILRKRQIKQKKRGYILIRTSECPDDAVKQLRQFSHDPENLLSQCRILKNSRHTLCARLTCASGNFFLKAYRSSGKFKALSYCLRKPKALKQWETAWLMWLRHLPVTPPCAALQKHSPWSKFYGALIFPWSSEAAEEKTKELLKINLTSYQSRDVILRNIAIEIWKMHQKGIFHGDCKITNFVLHPSGKVKEIFDLDSVKIKNNIGDRQRIKDLVCMCASLEKLLGKTREPWNISKSLLSFYISAHYPWQAGKSEMTNQFINSVEQKIRKSQSRSAHFRETLK